MHPKQRLITVVLAAFAMVSIPSVLSARELSFDERAEAQKAIEQVYWSHRIWPKDNPGPKPPLSEVVSDDAIREKVRDYVAKSDALEAFWQRPITGEQLQAELERMAKNSRDPQVLRELFAALGNDPYVIAETLVRQTLADRLIRGWYASDTGQLARLDETPEAVPSASWPKQPFDRWWTANRPQARRSMTAVTASYVLPAIDADECATDTWTTMFTGSGAPESNNRFTAVWTGSEMIVWGGWTDQDASWATGGRYTPSTDSWQPTSNMNAPAPRGSHSAVWTGTEMIVWSGWSPGDLTPSNTGGRYNPSLDVWNATSVGANVPSARRAGHTAVWTGTEMLVYGGVAGGSTILNTGGRYDPLTDSWNPMTPASIPRSNHKAVWTGSKMLVWGGVATQNSYASAGGIYDPVANSWTGITTSGQPQPREGHTAVWTGTEMIVWGGLAFIGFDYTIYNTGGRYDPTTGSWLPTSTGSNAPSRRSGHLAVWTGSEMIVWGGATTTNGNGGPVNNGGRYAPATNLWEPTSTTNAPRASGGHAAVWTGSEMIVWKGGNAAPEGGGRYCVGPSDVDYDGIPDSADTCPLDPANDADGDELCGDADPCPLDGLNDSEHDGVCGDDDNCAVVFNAQQRDSDADGLGDLCDNCPSAANASQDDADGDGAGDVCDCQPQDPADLRPAAVGSLSVSKSGTTSQIAWTAVIGADAYEITRGDLAALATNQYGSCLQQGVSGTTHNDMTSPAPGVGFFYLVQGRNFGCGMGSLGTDSNEQQRINADPAACPWPVP